MSVRRTYNKCFAAVVVALVTSGQLLACGTSYRTSLEDASEPLIELTYLSGGVSPTSRVMVVYDNGEICFTNSRDRKFCGEPDPEALRAVSEYLSSIDISEVETSRHMGMDWEEVWLTYRHHSVGVVLEEVPYRLKPLFRLLDSEFRSEFGSRYDIVLGKQF